MCDDHVAVSGCDALRFNNKACRSAWQCVGYCRCRLPIFTQRLPWPRVRTHALPALLLLACKPTFGRGMRTAKASVAQFLMHARAHTCTRKSQHEKKKME